MNTAILKLQRRRIYDEGKTRKKKTYLKMILSILLCVILFVAVIFGFQEKDEDENYTRYPELIGQIASVGDETLLIRKDDNTEYLISIAGVIDKNKGLLTGNRISVRYEGTLKQAYSDIQDIKVKKYQVSEVKIGNKKEAFINYELSQLIQNMPLEEKISQLFLVNCPESGEIEFIKEFKPGGLLLMSKDFKSYSQEEVKKTIQLYQNNSKIKMFIAVDEEGGTVVRVSKYFRNQRFQSPRMVYSQGGYDNVKSDTQEKDIFLKEFGINLNLAPVCDVSTNPDDFMYSRSFGNDASETAEYVETVIKQMNNDTMGSCLKYFPGYGNNIESQYNVVHDTRNYESIKEDLIPFQKGIEKNANMILVTHNIIDSVDETSPASLSKNIHDILRNDMAYDGIIITDDLTIPAFKELDSEENIAINAVVAGNDMIISGEISTQYQTILDAVKNDKISENQIDQSVLRVLYYKQLLNIN